MRFEYYLTLLEKSQFIIGNSSSALWKRLILVRAINLGNRQNNRYGLNKCININFSKKKNNTICKKF